MVKYDWPAYFVRVPGDPTLGYVVVATTQVFRESYKAAFRRFIAKSAFKLLVHSPAKVDKTLELYVSYMMFIVRMHS
jgi:hypothetical protein